MALVNANVVNVRDGDHSQSHRHPQGWQDRVRGSAAAPSGVTAIDVRGRYVIPGLIDAHTHIANFRAARTALESGVTTVRSAGVANYLDVGLRELVKKGAGRGPGRPRRRLSRPSTTGRGGISATRCCRHS